MSGSRILVIGAANAVGARVMRALRACGWAEPIAIEIKAPATPEIAAGVQGIVNAAAGSAAVIGAHARLTADIARAAGPQARVVHISSMTVYGTATGLIDESVPPRADLGQYAAAHIGAERLVGAHANTVILRPGCEYGPDCPQWSGRIARLLYARRLGDLGLAGDGSCNLLYIEDLTGAVLASLRLPGIGGETVNLAMRSPPSWNEYLIAYAIALRAVPIRRVTARRLRVETKLLAVPLKALEILSSRLPAAPAFSMPPITPSLLQLCGQHIVLEVSKSEALFGTAWTPVEQGIAHAAQAYRQSRAP